MAELKRRPTAQDDLLSARTAGPPSPVSLRRRHRRRSHRILISRILVRFLAAVAVLAALLVFGVPLLVRADRLQPQLRQSLSALTGRPVEMRNLRYSWLHNAVVANDFEIAEDPAFGNFPFLRARSVEFDVPFWSLLFSQRPRARRMLLDAPAIVLKQDAQGRWNYTSLLASLSRAPADTAPPAIEVTGGRVGVESDRRQLPQLTDLHLTVPRLESQVASSFNLTATLGGGKLQLKGQAGPLDSDNGQSILPMSVLVDLESFDLRAWTGAAGAGLSGWLSTEGSLDSNGHVVVFNGQATASKLRLSRAGQPAAEPIEAEFILRHNLDAHSGELSQCDFRVLRGMASLVGRYDTRGSPVQLNLTLSTTGAPVTQLAQFLPAMGIVLPPGANFEGGVVNSTLSLQGPLDHPAISGPFSVDDTRLNHFYLSQRLEAVSGLDAQELDDSAEILSWKANLQPAAGGVGIHDLVTDVAGLGELSGNGTIGADGSLYFTMSGIRGLTGPKGTPIPFLITGTSQDPVFQPLSGRGQ